jgi:anti-anti-sigma factor
MPREGTAQLTSHVTPGRNGLHVHLSGEIDMTVADQLVDLVLDLLPGQHDTIILDFAEVTFCDSSGINALIRIQGHQTQAGHTMRVINATESVRRVLELTGVADYLNVEDSPPADAYPV